MPKAHHILTNFTAGEVSTRIDPRVDYSKYQNACRTLEGFIIYPQGGITRRSGTMYVAEAKYSDRACILFPFIYNALYSYILEFGHEYVRFYRGDSQILSGASPYEISSPYDEDELFELQAYAQSADVVYITHPSHPVYKLTRLGHASWTLAEAEINDGPWLDENTDHDLYLVASATTGTGISLKCQNEAAQSSMGTWSDVAGADIAMFTAATLYTGVQFTAPATDIKLYSATISIAVAATGALDTNAYIYSSDPSTGHPLALLKTSPTTNDVSSTGNMVYLFENYQLTAATDYWIVFGCAVGDATTQASSVVANANYITDQNNTAITDLDPAGPIATSLKVNLTVQGITSQSLFDANHVGSYWRLMHTGQTVKTDFSSESTSSAVILRGKFTVDLSTRMSNDPNDEWWSGTIKLQKSFNQATYQDVATFYTDTRQEFFEPEGEVYYRLSCEEYTEGKCTVTLHQEEHFGVVKATAYVSASELTCDVVHEIRNTNGTPFWNEGAWSTYRGYPRSACFFEDRLWFAGTDYQPNTLWASWTGDYQNMIPHTTDDAPLSFTLLSQDNNAILWLMPHRDLVIGTVGSEWTLSGGNKAEALSAKNVKAQSHTTHGSGQKFRPFRIGPAVFFLQAARKNLMEFAYSFDVDGWMGADLNSLATHIGTAGFVQTAYQQKPDSILWSVDADGALYALTYYRKEDVMGWSDCSTIDGDTFESVAVKPRTVGESATFDQVWLVAARQVNGSTVRYIERMVDNSAATTKVGHTYLDSTYTYSGVAATTITGLDHLEGRTVSVWDGATHPDCIVSGGQITVNRSMTTAKVGLHKSAKVKPMRLEAGVAEGTAQGRRKRINKLVARFDQTLLGKYGASEDDLLVIPFRDSQDPMDSSSGLFSGDVPLLFPGGWETNGDLMIVQDTPAPMTILCLMPTLTVNE